MTNFILQITYRCLEDIATTKPITNLRSGDCSGTLTDGSVWGDWRLPTLNELEGITLGDEYIRYNQMYKFTGVLPSYYWSSATFSYDPYRAWVVSLGSGGVGGGSKGDDGYVWPVRRDIY